MTEPVNLTDQRCVAGRRSPNGRSEGGRGRSRLPIDLPMRLARFLLTWLAAFLLVVALFNVFGQQLKAMSPPLHALTVSGLLVIAMNFLVMPTLTRLFSRSQGPGTTSGDTQPQVIGPRKRLTRHERHHARGGRDGGSRTSVADLRLETDRLELRALTLDDLESLALMLGDAEGLIHWGPPLTTEESRSWIERNLRRYEADGFGRCAVILRSTCELVGDCGLIRTVVEGRPEVELGWVVSRAHRGKGIATEAAAAWRDYGFDVLGLERIVSMVSEKNVASRRVAEKLGMTIEREAMWGDLPHLMYSVHRDP